MKTFKLFSMAAIALMMGACSSDDNVLEQQPAQQQGKIPFSATISGANVTRTVIEEGTGSDAGKLVVAWKGDEEIALVHNGKKDVVPVTTVNPDGSAVITGSIDATGSDGEAVVLVYPADAVKSVTSGTTFVPNTDAAFLAIGLAQDGTLGYIGTNGLDGREGSGTLKISGGTATLNGNVTMESKAAIWELNLTTDGSTPLAAKTVTLKVGTQPIAGGAYASGKSKYYLCVVPKTLTTLYALAPTAAFTIEASDGTDTYTYTKTSKLSLSTGTFYQSTVMVTKPLSAAASGDEGKLAGQDGKIYATAEAATAAGTTAVAKIIYVGSSTGDATYTHGLALALTDESQSNWDDAVSACSGKNTSLAVSNASWMLPSQDQWNTMISAAGTYDTLRDGFSSITGASNLLNAIYWSSSGGSSNKYAISFNVGTWNTPAKTINYLNVRACLAF